MATLVAGSWLLQLASLTLAFLLSVVIARLYRHLYKGAPSTRTFAVTIALAGVVAAVIVLAIGDSIARGLGLVGAVTLVRFRSNLKDPLDLIFMFASLAAGVAAGAHSYFVAVLGTTVFLAGALVVARVWFAPPLDTFDAILSFTTSGGTAASTAATRALDSSTDGHALIRMRQVPEGQEHAYQIKLRRPGAHATLFAAIECVDGVSGAQLMAYDGSRDN
ncbi:MAG: DUF4956 domain-containing protein [Vicinamibacterales bacterium]